MILNDCNECIYISITEEDQNRMMDDKPHICFLLNKRVWHHYNHPKLPPLKDCPINKIEKGDSI